jgi:cell fate (sporulation/competence/biofilm development) regulator YmcA (YheA/YmcA/DUF963 family)
VNKLNEVIDLIKKDPEIIELNQIEKEIDNNEELINLIHKKQEISKEIVACKKIGLKNALDEYETYYNQIDLSLSEAPLMDRYLELLEREHSYLKEIISYIETKINEELKKYDL